MREREKESACVCKILAPSARLLLPVCERVCLCVGVCVRERECVCVCKKLALSTRPLLLVREGDRLFERERVR